MPKNKNKVDILRYVALELSSLGKELSADQKQEMEEIRARLGIPHEEILALGKSALDAE